MSKGIKNILPVLCIVTLFACQENKTQDNGNANTPLDTLSNITVGADTGATQSPSDEQLFQGHVSGPGKGADISVPVDHGKTLMLRITSENRRANIRIKQVIFPDQSMEGPWGREAEVAIKSFGTYHVLIGNNLMAEGDTSADFVLTATYK